MPRMERPDRRALGGTAGTQMRLDGRTMAVRDSLIAASALTHALTLATRKVDDFAACGSVAESFRARAGAAVVSRPVRRRVPLSVILFERAAGQ